MYCEPQRRAESSWRWLSRVILKPGSRVKFRLMIAGAGLPHLIGSNLPVNAGNRRIVGTIQTADGSAEAAVPTVFSPRSDEKIEARAASRSWCESISRVALLYLRQLR